MPATHPLPRSRVVLALWLEDGGATMVEYGIMIGLIALVCILAIQFVGEQTNTNFSNQGLLDALGG